MANIKISELNPLVTVQDADVLPIVDNAVTKKVTAAILRSYTEGNSVLLTTAQTIAGIKTFTSQIASSVATGTAPFSVASTTKVTNLNADLLDGLSSADFQAPLSGTGIVKSTAGTISYLTDNTANWDAAYNDKINSAAVTGSGTNTLTLTQQDAGTITASWVNGTLIREIRNNTGATLTKGTIVYISGATGNKPTVTKAIATGDTSSAQTFGFVQENILNNANGYVVVIGDLIGVDTSAFTEGDQLYLSSTVAGAFTTTKQYAPNHLVYVGIVTRSHPTLGQIEVNIQNGYELDELHNVAAQSPSNGDILQYVTSTGLWTKIGGTTSAISEGSNLYFTNARSRTAISLTTSGTSGAATYNSTTGVLNVPNYADTDTGITSLNGLTALTQTFAVGSSGTDFGISSASSTHTFNLPTASAANRGALSSADWTTFNNKQNALTNPITGTGTTNYLPKFTGTSALGNSIIYDSGTNVGIGTTSPNGKLQVKSDTNQNLVIGTQGGELSFEVVNDAYSANAPIRYYASTHNWYTGGLIKATLDASGQLGIGTTSPASTLDVNGTARVSENLTIGLGSATENLLIVDAATYSGVKLSRGGTPKWAIFNNNAGTNFFDIYNYTTTSSAFTISSTNAATFASSVTTGADATINGVTVGRGAGNIATNTAVGNGALALNTTGTQNTAIGRNALISNLIGTENTAIGWGCLFNNLADYNTAVGRSAMGANISGGRNTAIGRSALASNDSGFYNTAVGMFSLTSVTTASNNTAVGYAALDNNTASNNVAVGFEAATSNTSGTGLSVLGYGALRSNTTGAANTAIGQGALYSNITGSNNTAIGRDALVSNTASNNVAVGYEAGNANTSGAITAIGYRALKANTTGGANNALGDSALILNTTGSYNIGLGTEALSDNTTGSINIGIGLAVKSNNYSQSIIIGTLAEATASNQFVIGSSSYPAGAVATEVNASSKVWNVIINGVAQKILLA